MIDIVDKKKWRDVFPGVDLIPVDFAGTAFDGNPTLDEIKALRQIALFIRAQTIFEIGTFNGQTAIALASLPGIQQVWTLDLSPAERPSLPILVGDWRYIGTPKPDYPKNVIQLWGDSATFDFSWCFGKCDVVFVQGAHSLDYIYNDLEIAQKLVNVNGVIVLHAGTSDPLKAIGDDYDLAYVTDRMVMVLGEN